jgi:transcriptional regulator with XRE-family HTH domain
MQKRPDQPPEGRLLATALKDSGLSIREASRRAGISYGRWRQVVNGVQHVSPGNFAAVHAPAGTLARMAQAVGITADAMEAEGARPDAAAEMRRTPPSPRPQDDGWPGEAPGRPAEKAEDLGRLASFVTSARLAAGWKDVRSFATATGLTERTLSKLEHGQRVSAGTLAVVAQYVGWAPDTPRVILAGGEPPGQQAPPSRPVLREVPPPPLIGIVEADLSPAARDAIKDSRIRAAAIDVSVAREIGAFEAASDIERRIIDSGQTESTKRVLVAALRLWGDEGSAVNSSSG